MKKFSLKPQGGSCMKMFCKSWLFIGLLATFCLAACSDDDDKAEAPVFPAKQNIVCNAGETTDFTFTANTNWSLASSAIWCKFKSDATEEYVVSGTAGTHTVTVMATDDDQKVEKASVAKLELTMGGETIVIGEVTRSAVGTELKIFDLEGNEIDKNTGLKVGYDNFAQFKVKANFRFAATNLPGWVELQGGSLVGAVDKEVTGGLKIIQDENREKYPVEANIEKNVITFADEEGKAFYEFPVYYEGMDPMDIDIKLPSTASKYYWVVSLDGKTFKQSAGGVAGTGGSTTTLKNRVPFTVKALNDDYEVVFVEKGAMNDNLYLMDASYNEWMRCEREGGKVTLIVDEYVPMSGQPAERVGYVLVFPREEYERIKDNLEEEIINGKEIVNKYDNANLVLQFTQKEIKSNEDDMSITVVDGLTYLAIDHTSYKGDDASHFKTTYNVTSIFEIPQPVESTVVQLPNKWSDIKCYYFENEELVSKSIIEPVTEKDISISFKEIKKDVFLVISDEFGNNLMVIARGSTLDAGGDDNQQKIVVTGGTKPAVYTGSNAESLITMHNLADIWEITGTGENVEIEMPSSAISSFKVYDLDNGTGDIDITEEVKGTGDIEWKNNPMTGTPIVGTVNVYYGGWSSIIDRTLLIVVTCEDGTIHGIVVSKGN